MVQGIVVEGSESDQVQTAVDDFAPLGNALTVGVFTITAMALWLPWPRWIVGVILASVGSGAASTALWTGARIDNRVRGAIVAGILLALTAAVTVGSVIQLEHALGPNG